MHGFAIELRFWEESENDKVKEEEHCRKIFFDRNTVKLHLCKLSRFALNFNGDFSRHFATSQVFH